jgi:hypothetical protein
MNKPSINELEDLLNVVKERSHELNRLFFTGLRNKKNVMLSQIQLIWAIIHTFRSSYDELPDEEPYRSIQKMAAQLSRMRNFLLHNDFDKTIMEREFMVFRRFVEQYEKNIVRKIYFEETGIWAEKVGNLLWASKIIDKSEVTMRRYVFSGKVKGYKITKKWWIPFEEVIKLKK